LGTLWAQGYLTGLVPNAAKGHLGRKIMAHSRGFEPLASAFGG